MKRNLIYLILLCLVAFSCEKEEVVTGKVPRMVTNIEVTSLPGAVQINYTVPDDDDLLYIQASYETENGVTRVFKSSLYNNGILVDGFRSTNAYSVEIKTFSRSNISSDPIVVEAIPLKSPVIKVFESLIYQTDFGGPRISYSNEDESSVSITLFYKDENNRNMDTHVEFTNEEEGFFIGRGLAPVETSFGVYVKDAYGNISDTLYFDMTPYLEVEVDYNLMRNARLADDEPSAFGWVMTRWWDKNLNSGFHTNYVKFNNDYVKFTIDLGQTMIFSRYKFWQRQGGALFANGNFKEWSLYGCMDPTTDEWTHLGDYELEKPSGLPMGQNSQDDKNAGAAGHEFLFPLELPPVRYLQWRVTDTWGGKPLFVHVMELQLFGQPVED